MESPVPGEEAESDRGEIEHPLRHHEPHVEEEVRGGEEGEDEECKLEEESSVLSSRAG
jgi:hypothetical protein